MILPLTRIEYGGIISLSNTPEPPDFSRGEYVRERNINMDFVISCNCEDCVFTNLCEPIEKANRNMDSMCDDFTWIYSVDEEKDDDGINDKDVRKFPFGG